MKILQINVVCGIKSTGRITTDIATLAEQKGYECKVAYGREEVPASLQKYAVKIGTPFSNKCHAVLSRALSLNGFASKAATRRFLKWVDGYAPDVIHLHNVHGSYIHVGLLFDYLKKANKKVVWTLHDCWSFTGCCAYFDAIGCDKWKTGCGKCPQKCSYETVWIDKSKRNYARKKQSFTGVKDMTLVTPSKWLADLVGQSFLNGYPVKVIPNGIDLSKFHPTASNIKEEYGLQDKTIVLGVASSWGDRKGLSDFYRLSQLLDERYQVVLIGLTDEQKNAAPKSVLSLPATNSAETLAKWYTAADVFVNCTYEDNFPTVNLEAQACGCPVLTYATGGAVETVPPENTVKKGDVREMVRQIPRAVAEKRLVDSSALDKSVVLAEYLETYQGKV